MIHVIFGDEKYKVNKKINEISDGAFQNTIDVNNIPVSDIHKQMASIDLFGEKEVYILENIDLFEIKKSRFKKNEISLWEEIFKLENEIIILANKKLNEKTSFYENFFSKIKYYEFLKENIDLNKELENYINHKGIKIMKEAQNMLLHYHQELYALINDVDKMWQYSDCVMVTEDIVKDVGINYETYKVFILYEYIIKSNRDKAKEYYKILQSQSIDAAQILLIFLTQINKYYQVKCANRIFNGNNEVIAKKLKINKFQVKIINNQIRNIEENKLGKMISFASELDYLYKSGQVGAEECIKMLLR